MLRDLTRHRLDAGSDLYHYHAPGSPATTIAVCIPYGSRHEAPSASGVTHMLEHLLLRRGDGADDPAAALENAGAEVNGVTSKDEIMFLARVPTDAAAEAARLLAECVARPRFGDREVELERLVVHEELDGMAADPSDRGVDLLYAVMYGGGMARPVGGAAETLQSLDAETIRSHHAACFSRDELSIVAAGGAPADAIAAALDGSALLDLPAAASLPATDPGGPRRLTEGPSDVADVLDDADAYRFVGRATWGTAYADAQRTRHDVVAALVGAYPTSRLYRELRLRRGLSYDVSAVHRSFRDSGVLRVEIGCSADNVEPILAAVRAAIADAGERGWSEEELAVAKRQQASRIALLAESSIELAFWIARYAASGGQRDWSPATETERIGAVLRSDVDELTARLAAAPWWQVVAAGAGDPDAAYDLAART